MKDEIAVALQKRREELQRDVFNRPPANYEEFIKRLGVWNGIGEALKLIEDARKDKNDD